MDQDQFEVVPPVCLPFGSLESRPVRELSPDRSRPPIPDPALPPTYLACPTPVVEAPIETVRQLLTNFAGWGDFYDVRVLSVEPPGPAVVGQRMRGESGPRWLRLGICFEHTLVDNTHHKLEFEGRLPLGLTVHESLDCVPLDSQRCRVNYHCHFGFPDTWRGQVATSGVGPRDRRRTG
jgi:hypothetical protein